LRNRIISDIPEIPPEPPKAGLGLGQGLGAGLSYPVIRRRLYKPLQEIPGTLRISVFIPELINENVLIFYVYFVKRKINVRISNKLKSAFGRTPIAPKPKPKPARYMFMPAQDAEIRIKLPDEMETAPRENGRIDLLIDKLITRRQQHAYRTLLKLGSAFLRDDDPE
jgi:hypothetical protein